MAVPLCSCLCRLQFTPATYTRFVALYTSKLRAKARAAGTAVQRLRTGRMRLQEADTQVAKLRGSLQQLKPLIQAKSKAGPVCMQRCMVPCFACPPIPRFWSFHRHILWQSAAADPSETQAHTD